MSNLPWHKNLSDDLARRQAIGQYRQQRVCTHQKGVHVVIDGRQLLSFCSNDYLGLAQHPTLKKALIDATNQVGVGSGAAHLLTGHSQYHHELAVAIAAFTNQESALLFSSGYQANIAVISGLMARGDVVFQDKFNHASILDGARLSFARQLRYRHADMSHLKARVQQANRSARRLIVSDGVFSMDGDLAPLPELIALAGQYDSGLVIDDAHAFGVLGDGGRGSMAYWGILPPDAPIIIGTFGKAFGTAGAFVAARQDVIDTLVQQARPYIYTTAQPPAIAAATLASLTLVQQESWRRDKLHALIAKFKQGAQDIGLNLMPSITPIQPVLVGDDKKALQIGSLLEQSGVLVGVIRAPTVPKKSARLRITLSANHSEQHIATLLAALKKAYAH